MRRRVPAAAQGTRFTMNADENDKRDASARSRDETRQEFERAEEARRRSRPFSYPYPERRAGVRAQRRSNSDAADADTPPGVVGGYGTTSGGQPGAGSELPPAARTSEVEREGRDTERERGTEPDGG